MQIDLFDDRACNLGEGALWHPLREQFFWFDIKNRKLLTRKGTAAQEWDFDEYVSAAAWIDRDTLLIASQSKLATFSIETGTQNDLVALEADNPVTRSNDGRADPWGGFWIGTMGIMAQASAGAIYRLYRGELRLLFEGISIPNAICFAPDGSCAYFTDTVTQQVMRQPLDSAHGWPKCAPHVFVDTRAENLNPDGAITDASGNIWIAQWGASRVACYGPDGTFLHAIEMPARHVTCPAFGDTDFSTLFCTSAQQGLDKALLAKEPAHGRVFAVTGAGRGRAEPKFVL